jgi:hypothetical protein
MVRGVGGRVLFARDRDLDAWPVQLRHKFAVVEEHVLELGAQRAESARTPGKEPDALLPLVDERNGKVTRLTGPFVIRSVIGSPSW